MTLNKTAERDEALADRDWWKKAGDDLGLELSGWTFRLNALFFDRDTKASVELPGSVAERIHTKINGPSPNGDDIVERLRARTVPGKWSDTVVSDPDCSDAADTITRLQAENASLIRDNASYVEANGELLRERERQPQFDGLPKRKLDDLLARGWEISGYAIHKDGEHGLITTGGFVGWFTTAEHRALTAERLLAEAAGALALAREAVCSVPEDQHELIAKLDAVALSIGGENG